MNREQAKKFLPLIAAFAEGKTIQYKRYDGVWSDIPDPIWEPVTEYRIKPSPMITYVNVYPTGLRGGPQVGGTYDSIDSAEANRSRTKAGYIMELVHEEGKPVCLRPLSGK